MPMILPNFLIIGAYKCGTTSLYRYLSQHPDIFMPKGNKEPNFFALEGSDESPQIYGGRRRPITTFAEYSSLFDEVDGQKAIGEASPSSLESEQAPSRIKHYVPRAKLIAILRQPAEAFYSNYCMQLREGREFRSLEDKFRDFTLLLETDNRHGPFYYRQLKRYFDLFDSAQIRVYFYEDFKRDNLSILRSILGFLGVDSGFVPDLGHRSNVGGYPRYRRLHYRVKNNSGLFSLCPRRVKRAIEKGNLIKPPPMPRGIKQEFTKLCRGDIQQLQALTGRDLSAWLAS